MPSGFLRRMGSFVRLACFVAAVSAGSVHGTAGNARAIDLDAASTVPIRVKTSEKIVYDRDADEVSLMGNVVIERDDLHLSADMIRLWPSTDTALADGNVVATSGRDRFTGNRLELDLESETGVLFGGTLFLEQNNYHIQAEKIIKSGKDSYSAQDVVVTTCDGESRAWEVEGKELDITIGGYGTVNHALFRVKDVPVFYFPFMTFPVRLERQSGLLAPGLEFSERKGIRITQPYFWAISDSADMTVYADYMSLRGVKPGIEYRYFMSADDKGVAMFDFLDDRKVDDGSGTSSSDWGYPDDRYLRPNSERYWFRMKHDQDFGPSNLMLDLDWVSDQDYLYDFKSGYSGYTESKDLFEDVFSRSLEDYNDPIRKNRFAFSNQWPGYSLNAEALWWDDVIARRHEDSDETVQSLPAVYFERYKQPLLGTRLYAAFQTQSAYFYRKDGTRGARVDLYPRLYLPVRLGRMLSVEPSLGARETLWQIDRFEDDARDLKRNRHRDLYDFKLDLSSEIYNVFKPDWGEIGGLKHSAKFRVEYTYTPTLDQESYPYFDGVDRIEGENLITYSVVNTVTTRRGEPGSVSYHQAVRFELSQSFDVGRERAGDPEPFSPIEGDLQLDLGNWCKLRGDAAWSLYDNEFIYHNISYGFSNRRGDRLALQHRYSKSLWETVRGAVTLKLTDRIWISSEYERNLKDDLEIGKSFGVAYRAQCWSLETRYEEEENDRSIGFMVTLYGLGEMGGSSRRREEVPSWARNGF